jgi:pimeloyl-ACP methyl ester carboxylesterase
VRPVILFLLCAWAACAAAADRLVFMDTRPGVRVGYWLMERPGATATLMLLPGGDGGIGAVKGAPPRSKNFLVRSRDLFAAEGFNVAVIGRPSDHDDMTLDFRASPEHVEDLRVIATRLRAELGPPVWLVGTSRGTVSAAAAAARLDPSLVAGIVLTSSITGRGMGPSVTSLPLADIRVPVLVMHHQRDACRLCDPRDAHLITEALVNAPAKKLLLVDGGGWPSGPVCEPMHYHGYVGMEGEAVKAIAQFISGASASPRVQPSEVRR